MPIYSYENGCARNATQKALKKKAAGAWVHVRMSRADLYGLQSQTINNCFFEVSIFHVINILEMETNKYIQIIVV